MKYLKILGLTAVAAMALMAFLGASSASATVLCKTTQNVCAEKWDYPAGTRIEAIVLNTVLLKAGIEDTCTKGVANGITANTGSDTETVHGEIAELTFENCTCPVTVIKKGELEIHYEGEGKGTLTGKGSEVTVNCAGVTCTYGTAAGGTDLGTLDEPANSTSDTKMTISASLPKLAGGFFCASTGTWTGEYTVTKPVPLYVATKAEGQP
jgi:hypothetical protein